VLLDWSIRERLHALEWLERQDVPRDEYELIWVDAYERVPPEALTKADACLTCGQMGMYHKHAALNAGALIAKGEIVTICDSDAIYPPGFVRSILESFDPEGSGVMAQQVLMHYQWRTQATSPDVLASLDKLRDYTWLPLWPNVGACMSVRLRDYISFGGLDEHRSLRGYFCGPNDLGWRMANAGVPEVWHDPRVASWHFAHPDPPNTQGQGFSLHMRREIRYPHFKGHAMTSVEALGTGRILPLKENSRIFERRMAARRLGTQFEEEIAANCGPQGVGLGMRLKLWLGMYLEPLLQHPAAKGLYLRIRPFLCRLGLTVARD
jgi:hypothetical protein